MPEIVGATLEENDSNGGFKKDAASGVLCKQNIHVQVDAGEVFGEVGGKFGIEEKAANVFKKSVWHVCLLEQCFESGVIAAVVDVERLPPQKRGLVEKVDGMDGAFAVRYVLHGEIALHFLKPSETFEAITSAVVFGGLGSGVEFDNGGNGVVSHDGEL